VAFLSKGGFSALKMHRKSVEKTFYTEEWEEASKAAVQRMRSKYGGKSGVWKAQAKLSIFSGEWLIMVVR
jgi:hypothetical protein